MGSAGLCRRSRWRGRSTSARLPAHVAIIMDGNGRWAAPAPPAARRGPPRRHRRRPRRRRDLGAPRHAGAHALRLLGGELEAAACRGQHADDAAEAVPPARTRTRCFKNNIRFKVIGRADDLAPDVRDELAPATRRAPRRNSGMLFNIALNYGGRAEIVDAARRADRRPACDPGRHRRAALRAISSTPRASPTPTCSSARAARCASATSCSGRSPTPRSGSPTRSGPTSGAAHLLEAVRRVPETRPPLRRHQAGRAWPPVHADRPDAPTPQRRSCSSSLVGAAIWFLPTPALLVVAEAVLVLGVRRVRDAGRRARRADVPASVAGAAAVLAAASLGARRTRSNCRCSPR